jgi:hypothetical protein
MRTSSVREAFRLAGRPIVSLALLCLTLGSIALAFDPGASLALFIAGVGALVVFVLMADVVIRPPAPPAALRATVRPVDRRLRRG